MMGKELVKRLPWGMRKIATFLALHRAGLLSGDHNSRASIDPSLIYHKDFRTGPPPRCDDQRPRSKT
jgi:hypothetical protein